MMKLSKGFSTASILFTLLGVVAVGGIAYVAGKSSVPKNSTSDTSNYYPPTSEDQNTQQISDTNTVQQPANTTPSQTAAPVNDESKQIGPIGCPPSITILSPNGGEIYTAGQKITVKWKSCGLSTNTLLQIDVRYKSPGGMGSEEHVLTKTALNNGSAVVMLPTNDASEWDSGDPVSYGNNFYIAIWPTVGGPNIPNDISNDKFTINALQHISTVISSPYITGTHWPPTIQKSSAAYSCSPSVSEITTVAQKVINGRTYCIRSSIDGGAGHFGGDYTYTTASGTGTETATFQLQWTSCGGYGGPGDQQYDQCKADQTRVFNSLDAMVDSLM